MNRKIRTLNIEVPVQNGTDTPVHKTVIVVYEDNSPSKRNPVLRVVDIACPDGKDLLPYLCLDGLTHVAHEVRKEITRRLVYNLTEKLMEVA